MFSSAPPWLGHPGMGKPGPPHAPTRVTSPSPGTCHDTPPAAAPKFAPSNLELLVWDTDAGWGAHTHRALPASCAFGKQVGLV